MGIILLINLGGVRADVWWWVGVGGGHNNHLLSLIAFLQVAIVTTL